MDLLIYILKSAAVLSLFFIAYKLLLKNETFFRANRQFLLVGLFFSLIAPFLVLKHTVYKNSTVVNFNIPADLLNQSQVPEAIIEPIDYWQIGFILYAVGVLSMLLIFSKKIYQIFSFLKNSRKETSNGYHFVQIDNLDAPFSFFKYIVLDAKAHSGEELEMIILHEQAHANQLHSLDLFLVELVLILQWFNPLAWMYKNAIVQNLEFLADATTANQIKSRKKYQLTLVKVAVPKMVPALTHSFYQSFIKKRIVMLNKKSSSEFKKWKYLLIIPVVGAFMWSFNIKEEVKYLADKSQTAQSKNEAKTLFAINSETSDTELREIENYVNTETAIDLKIKVLERNAVNQILALDFLSRFDNQENYTKNISIKVDEAGSQRFDATLGLEEDNIVIFLRQKGQSDHKIMITSTGIRGYTKDIRTDKIVSSEKKKTNSTNSSEKMDTENQEVPKPFKKVINKDASKADLETLSKELQSSYNVSLDFSQLDYNSDGLLTSIKLKVKDNETGNQASSSYSSGKPIGDIVIYRAENGTFGVTSASNSIVQGSVTSSEASDERRKEMEFRRAELEKRGEEMRARMEEKRAEMDQKREEMKMRRKEIEERSEEILKESREQEINASQNDEALSYYKNGVTGESKVLFILNGEEINEFEFKMIKPEDIESINVLKGESAVALYQDKMKGKEGAILITTKVRKK